MKIKYMLEGLDCANCAAKIENAVAKIEGVKEVTVSFMTTKMTLEVDDEAILGEVEKVVRKVEPDVNLKRI